MNGFSFRAHPEKFGNSTRRNAETQSYGENRRKYGENWRKYGENLGVESAEIFDVFLKVPVVFDTFALRAWNPILKNTTR